MHLNEGVEFIAQEPLVISRGHAFERLEEQLLLLGGRENRAVCLKSITGESETVWYVPQHQSVIQDVNLALRTLHMPCLHRWQHACVQRRCTELRRLQWRLAVAAAHVMVLVLVVLLVLVMLRWYHLHLRRQPVELRVVHWVPARHGMHAAKEETALHLLLLLPHGHRLRLQR